MKNNNKEKFFIFSNRNPYSSNEKLNNSQINLNNFESNVNKTSVQKIKNKNKLIFKKTTE
jgi:hypothetical protein